MNGDEFVPLVREMTESLTPEKSFLRLSERPHCLFLDSSLRDKELGRYSFLTADPFDLFRVPNGGRAGSVAELRILLSRLRSSTMKELPPFQGGVAGVFGYEFGRQFESLPIAKYDELELPDAVLGFYDVVLAFDHQQGKSWLISQGFPETEPGRRKQRAERRMQQFVEWLQQPESDNAPTGPPGTDPVRIQSPHELIDKRLGIYSNFSRDTYRRAVEEVIEYICAGDIFQANLSQRLMKRANDSSTSLYLRLRKRTPATFAGYFDAGPWQVICASPERFVRSRNGAVEARPVKGTRPQKQLPEADLFAGDDLLSSGKDRAENTMIVDLLRNDLSRVCEPASVQVPQLCGLETYGYVQHLVSVVRGQLREDQDALDVLAAAFPGGSITGAPKVRAMEIITHLEQVSRGPYCGSLGYIDWDGEMDLNILIRTVTAAGGWWQFPVGGGVVAQSQPSAEYEETWDKAQGVLAAME